MIDENNLFKGTKFAPSIQKAIYKDILAMHQYFPNMFPFPYKANGYSIILLQGTVTIKINNSFCPLSLNISLPDKFPFEPPIAQIPIRTGFPLYTSNSLTQDGTILTQNFFTWTPRNSRLPSFVNSIVEYFSQHPPFSLENGLNFRPVTLDDFRKDLQDQAVVEAVSIFENIKSEIKKCQERCIDDALTIDMAQTINTIYHDLKKCIDENQEKLDALESSKLPEVPIDPQLELFAKTNSKNVAFLDAKSELQNCYENNLISLDDFLQATRELSRDHFLNVIYPSLT